MGGLGGGCVGVLWGCFVGFWGVLFGSCVWILGGFCLFVCCLRVVLVRHSTSDICTGHAHSCLDADWPQQECVLSTYGDNIYPPISIAI